MTTYYHVEVFDDDWLLFVPCFGNATKDYCDGFVDAVQQYNPKIAHRIIATEDGFVSIAREFKPTTSESEIDLTINCDKSYQHVAGKTCEHCRLPVPELGINDIAAEMENDELETMRGLLLSFETDACRDEFHDRELRLIFRLAAIGLKYCEDMK